MRVQSLVYENYQHQLIEVEVTLHPGLPGIQILGLPDAVVKDCVWRIKSAFLQSGFQWPTESQVIVNLKPANFRKRGTGLDLAIAAAILWETGQCPPLQAGNSLPLLYGELDLLGEVHAPIDLCYFQAEKHKVILTGRLEEAFSFSTLSISALKDLPEPEVGSAVSKAKVFIRPPITTHCVSNRWGEYLGMIATGEHPTLLAGRSGSGKTTAALALGVLIEEPSQTSYQNFSRYHSHAPLDWRPFRAPHHTTSALAMIGGGVNNQPGELTRSHGGILLMDEFLEFDSSVQEALREPLEKGVIELIRSSRARVLPASFLLLATTNLCKCGEFEPGKERSCTCGQSRRKHYLERFSGPMLDRFANVVFSSECDGAKTLKMKRVLDRVQDAIEFRKKERKQFVPNARLSVDEIRSQLAKSAEKFLLDEKWTSERRIQHFLRVARSFADLALSPQIQMEHLEDARKIAVTNLAKLKAAADQRVFPIR